MKKNICLMLGLLLIGSALSLTGCGQAQSEPLKLGLGIYTDVTEATDATEDKNGQGSVEITAATVLLDRNGKILSCVLDTAAHSLRYTADGQAIANDSFFTKYESGKDYNMVAYGGAAKEWYEQVDALTALIKGKTLAEVKALVADGNKGNDDVIKAGCTISISSFVLAIEKACNRAVDSAATASDTLKLGVDTEQTTADATEEKNGYNQTETTFFAAATDGDGRIVAAVTDCVSMEFAFDPTGKATTDITRAVSSKGELGDGYGMVAYGGAQREWYEQAAAFVTTTIGKTPSELYALMDKDGNGTADVQTAGCTIRVDGFVKAAAKIF